VSGAVKIEYNVWDGWHKLQDFQKLLQVAAIISPFICLTERFLIKQATDSLIDAVQGCLLFRDETLRPHLAGSLPSMRDGRSFLLSR